MKVLKVLGLVFSSIAFSVAMILFFSSLYASYVLEDGITNFLLGGGPKIVEGIQRREVESIEVSEIDVEQVYNEILDSLGITEEQLIRIVSSPVVKDLASEFVDEVLNDITTGETSDFDVGKKVVDFVVEHQKEIEEVVGQPIPIDKLEEFAESEEVKNFNEQYKTVISTVSGQIPAPIKNIINTIERFISKEFRIGCLIVGGILLVLIALLQWSLYKWIRTLGNNILWLNVMYFITSLFGGIISNMISAVAGLNAAFEFGKVTTTSAVAGGIGIILLIIYAIISKNVKKGELKNAISQNAC